MPDIFFTVLRWTILAALIGAILGAPVVYLNHREKVMYDQGFTNATAECTAKAAAASKIATDKALADVQAEAEKALAAQTKATETERKAAIKESKLKDELAKAQIPVGCVLNERITGSLRDFAAGTFEPAEGNSLPSTSATAVPGIAPFPPRTAGNTS